MVIIITVGVEMSILEGIKILVCLCDCLEACLSVTDHNTLSKKCICIFDQIFSVFFVFFCIFKYFST